MNKVIITLMAVPLLAGIAGAVAPRWLVSALLGASATLLYLLLYAPPLFHVVEAAAAPRWNPKDSRGLVAPAHSASARLLLLERRAEQDD